MSIKIVANSSVTQTTLHCFVGRLPEPPPPKKGRVPQREADVATATSSGIRMNVHM